MRAFEEYQAEVSKKTDDIDMLKCAVLIARHAYPDLEEAQCHEAVDALASEVQALLPQGQRYPLKVIKAINKVLYKTHGYHGNTADYYTPDNSCINKASDGPLRRALLRLPVFPSLSL